MKINKYKKVISIIMLILMLFSAIQPVFAASGTGTYSGGQYASGMKTTDNQNSSTGVLIRRLNNLDTGERLTVFCAEHGVEFATGAKYGGEYYTPTNSSLKRACKIAYLGWYKDYGDYTVDGGILASDMIWVKWAYVFTQQYIWETLGQSSATFINADEQAGYESFKASINSQIAQIEARPSFNNTTITVTAGESKTITDSNGALASYNAIDVTQDGVRYVHNAGSNEMTITVSEDVTREQIRISDSTFYNWGMIKGDTEDHDTTVYFEFPSGIQDQLYAMHYNDPVTLNLSLKIELLGNLELQKTDTTGTLVNGAIYNVSGNGFNQNVEVTNGKITVEGIKKGTYTIKEVQAPEGYLLDKNTYTVDVMPNQTVSKAIVNKEPTASLKLNKTDIITGNTSRVDNSVHHGDATLKGAIYTLYAKKDIHNVSKTKQYFSANEEIATFTFDENGNSKINITNSTTSAELKVEGDYLSGLPIGEYYAKETNAPIGYNLDTKEYTYNFGYVDQNTEQIKKNEVVTNDVQRAKFEVIKISSNDNTTANVIANAEFTAILNKYVEHYGSFEEALNHVSEFADDEYSIFRTGENGHGVSKALAYGEYMVKETYTPSDEIETVEPFFINIDKNSDGVIKEFIENDMPFESYLKMIKIDKNTGKTVTFSNTTFSLYRLNNNEWEKVKCKTGWFYTDKWKTNKEGIAVTEDKLPCGTYKIDEIELPDGFLELDEEVTFKINKSNKSLEFDKDYDAYITVKVGNEQPTGTIKLDKTILLNENVDLSLLKDLDLTKIEFTLIAKGKIIDYADGSTIYEEGTTIGDYNLSKEGTLEIKNLPMGKYELKETKTLDGLVLDNTPLEVELKKEDNTTKAYTKEIKVENKATEIEISKTDITGDKELEGAKLTVLDGDEIIESWTSTDTTHKIEGLLVDKEYTLREEIAPEGYVKATDIKFTIQSTGEVQRITMKDKIVEMSKSDIGGEEVEGAEIKVYDEDNNIVDEWTSTKESHIIKGLEEGKTYTLHEEVAPDGYVKATDITFEVTTEKENQKVTLIDKVVKITKTDLTTSEELEGAELEVTDEEGNILDSWTSTKESHIISGLEEGKTYTLTEKTAPYGYEITESITFTVSEDKETQEIVMKDMPILKNVKVEKIDSETKETIYDKFVFGIYKDSECTKLIKQVESDEDTGTALFEELRYGTYYIKESKAPKGYELSDIVVKIDINDNGIFIDDQLTEETDNTVIFTYENKKIEVPQTGDNKHLALALGIGLLSLLGLAYIGIKTYKMHKDNKK